MNNKISYSMAGAIIFATVTAITVLLASLGGYWLAAISAILGAYVGSTIFAEEMKKVEIPDDWYEDFGPTNEEIGKTTKH